MRRVRWLIAAGLLAASGAISVDARADAKGGARKSEKAKAPTSFAARPAPGTKARCAVANEEFTIKEGTVCETHDGRHYCFCCADCKPEFEKNPAKYADKK